MSENLPSVNELVENISSNYPKLEENNTEGLPSVEDYFVEELPSVDNYIVEDVEMELNEVELPEEIVDASSQWNDKEENIQRIINLIENVRKEIPEIPEIKTYDKELYDLMGLIEDVRRSIPDVLEVVEDVRHSIPNYDDDITSLEGGIEKVRSEIPEVKYYDEDVEGLQNKVEVLSNKIQEVSDRDIPNFGWIGKAFNTIDEDFGNVKDRIETIRHQFDEEVRKVYESLSVSEFENKTSISQTNEEQKKFNDEIVESLDTIKEGIYNQLKETSLRIWTLNNEYKNDEECIGFIAQEMLPVIPEVVIGNETDEDGEQRQLSLSYSQLTAVAFKAIQEQQALIKTLQEKVETLEAKVTSLESA